MQLVTNSKIHQIYEIWHCLSQENKWGEHRWNKMNCSTEETQQPISYYLIRHERSNRPLAIALRRGTTAARRATVEAWSWYTSSRPAPRPFTRFMAVVVLFFFLLYSATMARGMLGSIAALAGWSEGYIRDTYRSVFDTYSYPLAYLRRIRRFRDISGYPSQWVLCTFPLHAFLVTCL